MKKTEQITQGTPLSRRTFIKSSLAAGAARRCVPRGGGARSHAQVLAQTLARVSVHRQAGIRLITPDRLPGTLAHVPVHATGPVSQLGEHSLDVHDQSLE